VAVVAYVIFGLGVPSSRPGTTHTYTTDATHHAALTLDDGTRVTLAPGTTLRLSRFGSRSRDVMLSGEAYFEVVHTSGAPFLVHSGLVTTQVLGTTFLVRHRTGEAGVHVAVAEGKVRVTPGPSGIAVRPAVTLTAGRVVNVSDSTVDVFPIEGFTPGTGWASGKLSFHDAPLRDVLTALSQWYGREFRVADPALTRERVTLVLTTKSLTAALANLEQLLSVGLTVTGDTITLTPRPAQPANGARRTRTYHVWTPIKEVGR
jgi:transmembrane sensor